MRILKSRSGLQEKTRRDLDSDRQWETRTRQRRVVAIVGIRIDGDQIPVVLLGRLEGVKVDGGDDVALFLEAFQDRGRGRHAHLKRLQQLGSLENKNKACYITTPTRNLKLCDSDFGARNQRIERKPFESLAALNPLAPEATCISFELVVLFPKKIARNFLTSLESFRENDLMAAGPLAHKGSSSSGVPISWDSSVLGKGTKMAAKTLKTRQTFNLPATEQVCFSKKEAKAIIKKKTNHPFFFFFSLIFLFSFSFFFSLSLLSFSL